MSDTLKLRPRLRGPQGTARYVLLALIPLLVLFNFYVNNLALSRDIAGITFVQPLTWQYHGDTAVIPQMRRIHFSAAGIADAIAHEHGVPLFVLTKYPADHAGLNPLLGINVFSHDADLSIKPEVLLQTKLEQVQAASGQALDVVEPVAALPIATLPGARVVLSAHAGKEARGLSRLTVYALVAGRLSFTIVASDAASGTETMDKELATFISSVAVD